jgi:hypothetical protein
VKAALWCDTAQQPGKTNVAMCSAYCKRLRHVMLTIRSLAAEQYMRWLKELI